MTDAWTLLQRRRKDSGPQPLVTFVDSAAGERTELSATSVENAASKIANTLVDEYDLASSTTIAIDLPIHWQRTTWCAGAWTAGCALAPDETAGTLLVSTVDRAERLDGPVTVVSTHPLGLPVTTRLPAGVTDATVAILAQPDVWLGSPPSGDAPALRFGGLTWTQDEVLHQAAARATAWGLGPGGRLLVDDSLSLVDGWLAALAVPLVARASVVLVSGEFDVTTITATEQVTAVASSAS